MQSTTRRPGGQTPAARGTHLERSRAAMEYRTVVGFGVCALLGHGGWWGGAGFLLFWWPYPTGAPLYRESGLAHLPDGGHRRSP
jgi:hypothetical protein